MHINTYTQRGTYRGKQSGATIWAPTGSRGHTVGTRRTRRPAAPPSPVPRQERSTGCIPSSYLWYHTHTAIIPRTHRRSPPERPRPARTHRRAPPPPASDPVRAGERRRGLRERSGPCSAHAEARSWPELLAPPRRQPRRRRVPARAGGGGCAAGGKEEQRLSLPVECAPPARPPAPTLSRPPWQGGGRRDELGAPVLWTQSKREARVKGKPGDLVPLGDSAQSPLPPKAGAPHLRSSRKL